MTKGSSSASGTSGGVSWGCVISAIGIFFATTPGVAYADANFDAWGEMVRRCEAVITEQSFAPFEGYEPAPFTSGKPGQREYSAYSPNEKLASIARVLGKDDWTLCYVRESQEDRTRTRDFYAAWRDWAETTFARSEYLWGNFVVRPDRANPVAIRCDDEAFVLAVYGSLETDFHFRVIVTNDVSVLFPASRRNPCRKEDT